MKPYKEVCRCGSHISWHDNRKGQCMVSKYYSNKHVPCPCKEYIPSDNLEYLEMLSEQS